MTLIPMATGNRAHTFAERGHDLYETPPVAVRVLSTVETIPATVWEPCCGPGSIVKTLRDMGRAVIASDLVDYGCPASESGVDFLMTNKAPNGVATIVTNPPFKLAEEFTTHALTLVPEVYLLMRVGFLEGLRWHRGLSAHLARIHVFAPRLPMMHRAGWDGPINNNSAMAFAWYSFQRDWGRKGGKPTINWVNWREVT